MLTSLQLDGKKSQQMNKFNNHQSQWLDLLRIQLHHFFSKVDLTQGRIQVYWFNSPHSCSCLRTMILLIELNVSTVFAIFQCLNLSNLVASLFQQPVHQPATSGWIPLQPLTWGFHLHWRFHKISWNSMKCFQTSSGPESEKAKTFRIARFFMQKLSG